MSLPNCPSITNSKKDRDPANLVEIFNSGGGVSLLLDLDNDLPKRFEPQAMLVDTKGPRDVLLKSMSLFPCLDTWLAIALAEA
jgi:hypothetical protein